MDQTNNARRCLKHSDNNLEFIQVRDINLNSDKNLFYCSVCINEDLSFKGLDYILIKQIVTSAESKIIQKWPPINDQSILEELSYIIDSQNTDYTIERQIISFFDCFKNEIFTKIDVCQKTMINLAKEHSFDSKSIFQKYESISQLGEFKNILSNYQEDMRANEQSCKDFILRVEKNKEINERQLQDLLNRSKKKQTLINFDLPNQLKDSILSFIDQINFFDIDQNSSQSLQRNAYSQKIMQLISNQSNYCSDQFLGDVRKKLSQLNSIFSSISFENQFKENNQPIDFTEITNEQLHMIRKHVNHLTELNTNSQYRDQIENKQQIKQLKKILGSKFNLIGQSFRDEFNRYLIDTYPYLSLLDFEQMITNIDRFQKTILLSDSQIDNLLKLSEKMNDQGEDHQNSYFVNNLKEILNSNFIYNEQNEIANALSTFLIFSMIKFPDYINILPRFNLVKGQYNNGYKSMVIKKLYDQIVLFNEKDNRAQYISSEVLEKDQKYIFRFKIERLDQKDIDFMLGLMQKQNIHIEHGSVDHLCCCFKLEKDQNQIKQQPTNYGISKLVKNEAFLVNCQDNQEEIELRVCIDEQILEITDFPNYKSKIVLCDEYKQNLINHKELVLYIGTYYHKLNIILKQALVVSQFKN